MLMFQNYGRKGRDSVTDNFLAAARKFPRPRLGIARCCSQYTCAFLIYYLFSLSVLTSPKLVQTANAEGAGFEPARAFTPCLFSKEVHSTALTPLHRPN